MRNQRARALRRGAAALLTISLVAAACGDDDDDEATAATDAPADTEAAATDAPADTEAAATDAPADTEATEASEAPADTDASGGEMAEPEQSDLTIGLIPIADVAPVFIGLDRGIFEEYGLNVTTEFAAGGAAAIPAVVAGDIDMGFGAYPSTLTAIEAGIPLEISSEAVRSGPLFAGLYSMPDSGIETVEDMAGATVAVNTLDNIVQIAVQAQLEEVGLSLDDVTLVEIGFPDMVAALETGNVDVISVVEPFGSIARNTLDANLIVDMFSGPLADFPVAGFFVTEDFATSNPNTIAAFNAAFAEATDIAVNEEGALVEIVPTYTSASPEAAAALNYPNMVAGLDAEYLQVVSDYMVEQGLLTEPIVVADHIVETG